MTGFFVALAVAFGAIFVAELGDKSQLMALTFATRFRTMPILIGITVATAVVHAVSVGVGALLRLSIPTRPISVIAGIGFLGFAAWTKRGDQLDADEQAKADQASGQGAVIAASSAFFLAELGDKTMLATITLATKYEAIGVWLGSTVGMVGADYLAIVIGKQLGARLPERAIKIGATISFVVFGVILIVEGLRG